MMSIEYMNHLAERAARKAARSNRNPKTFRGLGHDAIRAEMRRIPFVGSFVAKGWKRVDVPAPRLMGCTEGYLFVDSSGWGARGEPALTMGEFVDYVYGHDEYGYAIVESGQFQCVIAGYQRRLSRPKVIKAREQAVAAIEKAAS